MRKLTARQLRKIIREERVTVKDKTVDVNVTDGDIYVDDDLDNIPDHHYSAEVLNRPADIEGFSFDKESGTITASGKAGFMRFDEDMPPPDAEHMMDRLGDDTITISKDDGGPSLDVKLRKSTSAMGENLRHRRVRRLIRALVRESLISEDIDPDEETQGDVVGEPPGIIPDPTA
tara:strand:- start:7167 stop:7691 length:525 start_codon:yes stop_codon:yes gene_type:complete